MRRLQAVLYYCGCFMYFCPMIENLCKNTAFAQKTTWHKRGAAFLQKGLAKNPKIRAAGMRKPFLLPSRYRARKKLNGRTKKRAYAMHRLFNANACGRRHMMQEKPWHWRVRHHHGQGGGRAQRRERQGDVATTQIQAAVVKIAAPAGFSAHPAGGGFRILRRMGVPRRAPRAWAVLYRALRRGALGLFAKRPGEKPENPRGGDAQAVPAPVPVQGAEKVERARKKTCIRHAQAIQCQCMWAPPYDAGEAMALARPPPPRARWRTRTVAGKTGGTWQQRKYRPL